MKAGIVDGRVPEHDSPLSGWQPGQGTREEQLDAMTKAWQKGQAALDAIASMPATLRQLDQTRSTGVWRRLNPNGASATFGIGLRFAGGESATVLCDLDQRSRHLVDISFDFGPSAESASSGDGELNGVSAESRLVPAGAARELLANAAERSRFDDLDPDHPWQRLHPLLDWALALVPIDSNAPHRVARN